MPGNSNNTDPKTGDIIPNDNDPKKPKSPKGPSVNTNPGNKNVVNNGGAHIIVWLPEDLEIVQQGGDPNAKPAKPPTTHGVVQPKVPMTSKQFAELLKRIKTRPYVPPKAGGGQQGGGSGGQTGTNPGL